MEHVEIEFYDCDASDPGADCSKDQQQTYEGYVVMDYMEVTSGMIDTMKKREVVAYIHCYYHRHGIKGKNPRSLADKKAALKRQIECIKASAAATTTTATEVDPITKDPNFV